MPQLLETIVLVAVQETEKMENPRMFTSFVVMGGALH
jgi:hypothetical protein